MGRFAFLAWPTGGKSHEYQPKKNPEEYRRRFGRRSGKRRRALSASCAISSKAAESDTIKVGILHSLSGTIAIIESSLHDAELLAIEEINAKGGVIGKKLQPVIEDPQSLVQVFAEKAKKLLLERQGRRRPRLLHLGEPPIGAAGVRAEQRRAALSDALRSAGMQQELLLYRRGAEPAARRLRALDHQDAGPQEILSDRRQLHLSEGDQPRGQGAAQKHGGDDGGRGIFAARLDRVLDQHQQDRLERRATSSSPTWSATQIVAFYKQFRQFGITANDIPICTPITTEQEIAAMGAGERGRPLHLVQLLPERRHARRTSRSSSATRRNTARTR